jgi:lipid-binding SYLF domain-containing protein
MFKRRITAGLLSGVVAVGLLLSGQTAAALTAQEAAALTTEAKATQAKFQAATKGSEAVFAGAKGVLVCPKITKGGFILGVESGSCVLTSGAPKPVYWGTSALKAGLLVGIASYSMILVLNTDAALAKFSKGGPEWEMGVDASVAVAKVGASGALDTTNLKKDVVSFIFGDKGLMGDVSFQGSRFKMLEVK